MHRSLGNTLFVVVGRFGRRLQPFVDLLYSLVPLGRGSRLGGDNLALSVYQEKGRGVHRVIEATQGFAFGHIHEIVFSFDAQTAYGRSPGIIFGIHTQIDKDDLFTEIMTVQGTALKQFSSTRVIGGGVQREIDHFLWIGGPQMLQEVGVGQFLGMIRGIEVGQTLKWQRVRRG